jgi:hypothetical protein
LIPALFSSLKSKVAGPKNLSIRRPHGFQQPGLYRRAELPQAFMADRIPIDPDIELNRSEATRGISRVAALISGPMPSPGRTTVA